MEKQALHPFLAFSNKVVLITGSGTGIGQSIAKKFAQNGANIIIMGRRKEPLEQTTKALSKIIADNGSSARVMSFPGVDVSDETGIDSLIKHVSEGFGRIDIVVNNAGVSGPVRTFTNASFAEFRDCVAIHLTGTFWTARQCLQLMEHGAKIITISTFFTEENRYEQRPYRFRTPYTAAQGAKNRLAEALAWELADDGIRSIASNPGPVHSDRIYKTVYPKAAAEFLRIGGYAGLSSLHIDYACNKLLPLLGQDNTIILHEVRELAQEIEQSGPSATTEVDRVQTLSGLLKKLQEIAEKIQNNTRKMIVDQEFLSQEDVADIVLSLCDDKISKLINGRVVPSDRVFYPVRPIIRTSLDQTLTPFQVAGKVVIIMANPSNDQELERVSVIARALHQEGVKDLTLFLPNRGTSEQFHYFSCIEFDLLNEELMRIQLQEVRQKFGVIDAVIYLTGGYDYTRSIISLSRREWDSLVDRFINLPAMITKETVNAMCPGAVLEPVKYRNSNGKIILIGPESPTGTKISGLTRARSEIFRGALRPYTATVNQELFELLGSNIRLFLMLPGTVEGAESDVELLSRSVLQIISNQVGNNNDSIFCIDEVRP